MVGRARNAVLASGRSTPSLSIETATSTASFSASRNQSSVRSRLPGGSWECRAASVDAALGQLRLDAVGHRDVDAEDDRLAPARRVADVLVDDDPVALRGVGQAQQDLAGDLALRPQRVVGLDALVRAHGVKARAGEDAALDQLLQRDLVRALREAPADRLAAAGCTGSGRRREPEHAASRCRSREPLQRAVEGLGAGVVRLVDDHEDGAAEVRAERALAHAGQRLEGDRDEARPRVGERAGLRARRCGSRGRGDGSGRPFAGDRARFEHGLVDQRLLVGDPQHAQVRVAFHASKQPVQRGDRLAGAGREDEDRAAAAAVEDPVERLPRLLLVLVGAQEASCLRRGGRSARPGRSASCPAPRARSSRRCACMNALRISALTALRPSPSRISRRRPCFDGGKAAGALARPAACRWRRARCAAARRRPAAEARRPRGRRRTAARAPAAGSAPKTARAVRASCSRSQPSRFATSADRANLRFAVFSSWRSRSSGTSSQLNTRARRVFGSTFEEATVVLMTPLVLVHGNPEIDVIWDPLAAKLGREAIRLSPPGFGAPVPEGFEPSPRLPRVAGGRAGGDRRAGRPRRPRLGRRGTSSTWR